MPSIPEQCIGCAVQCEALSSLATLILAKAVGNFHAERLVGDEGTAFDELIDKSCSEESADLLKSAFRQALGGDLDEIDEGIEEFNDQISSNALACSGVLKMRASRDGASYTVSVCTSPLVYGDDSTRRKHVPTHILRTPAAEQN
jgi:hypothetical protein